MRAIPAPYVASLGLFRAAWAWLPFALVVAGGFGIRGFAAQRLLAASAPRQGELRLLRLAGDVVALVASVAGALSLLAFVFGGRIGLMRG